MLNTEIGTYQIAEALSINLKLNAKVEGRAVRCKINGETYVGCVYILLKLFPKAKFIPSDKDNVIVQKKNAVEVLRDTYGVKKDKDWELVYNPKGVWSASVSQSTADEKAKANSSFTLESDLEL